MSLSVIIPIYNEELNLNGFYKELKAHLKLIKKYEIIFVDDGSSDKSFEILESIAKKDRSIKIVRLRSNYGQTVAIRAGLDVSKGNKIIIMDGDGQHHPKYIVEFYKK